MSLWRRQHLDAVLDVEVDVCLAALNIVQLKRKTRSERTSESRICALFWFVFYLQDPAGSRVDSLENRIALKKQERQEHATAPHQVPSLVLRQPAPRGALYLEQDRNLTQITRFFSL